LRRRRWPQARSFRGSILGFFFRFGSHFRLCLGFGDSLNLLANLLRDICWNRARMRLFFRDAIPRQKVNNGFRFDL
jgi:hypothetical protein